MTRAMSLAEKQGGIVARLSLIEDMHERLAALMSRAKKIPAPDPAQLTEENRVQGCQSRVWLTGGFADGACRWRMDCEAPMVKGLVGLLCELYEGATADEVIAFEPTLIADLGLARMISGTRIAGLAAVRMRMRQIAAAFPANP